MLAQIEDFTFEIKDTAYDKLNRRLTFRYGVIQRIGNFDLFQNAGKHEEDITIEGILICKSQDQIKAFEDMAKEKKARTMSFSNGRCKTVVIMNIDIEQSNFLKTGEFLRQSFRAFLAVDGNGL